MKIVYICKMKNKITLLLLAFSFCASAQIFDTKKERNKFIAMASCMYVSGYARGLEQKLMFDYKAFEAKHPSANQWYWNPQISWRNKYQDRLPYRGERFKGSSTVFVWTTDAKHMLDAVNNIGMYATLTISLSKPFRKADLKKQLIRSASLIGVRYLGFYTSYNFIYK